ncbi:MAG: acetate--CoA ligase family protein [Deltaproteobacteria bacterium]|nr:acetate--CoA ligase family protein [Deltaproteobacteria bacterium]
MLINKAKAESRFTLTEAEAKQILDAYGIPVVKEVIASTPEEAAKLGDQIGYPAVLKGLGSKLTHKTERGLVRLNLKNKDEILAAAQAVGEAAGADLDGYLVQPMIAGRREFVAGLSCDPQFGPVIMFGLGGIFTEAIGDVTFRVAPLKEAQAEAMIDELRTKRVLQAFRGDAPVNREELIKTLVGLACLGLELENVTEVDINPLIADTDGHLTAVDALIVLGKRPEATKSRPTVDIRDIHEIFAPRSIAFIGASAQFGKWGQMLFTNCAAGGFEGDTYLVNVKGEPIFGRSVYESIADIPGDVDLGIVTLPAAHVLNLLPQFQAKGIKHMLLITSGFAETGEEGRQLEQHLVEEAAKAGILILGPNTMGICNPHTKFYCTGTPSWPKPGSIGLVSQSGNLGTQLICFAEQEEIGIRAFCGSGNEAMITIEDFIRGFEHDDLTKTTVLYIESVKDGRRFVEEATRVSRKKPIIVLKGGRTDAGNRAAASHAGALASNIEIFNAACRQAGIVLAKRPMELLDLSTGFSALPLPKGNRVAVMTLGGGWGVVATDACIESGLEVPPLSLDLIAEIDKILPPYWSRTNPVDLVGEWDPSIPFRIIEELVKWDGCDALIHLGAVGRQYMVTNMIKANTVAHPGLVKEDLEMQSQFVDDGEKEFFDQTIRLMEQYQKPIIGVRLLDYEGANIVEELPGKDYKGVSFLTPERAVNVLARLVEYNDWLIRNMD